MFDELVEEGWSEDSGNWPIASLLLGGHEHMVRNVETGGRKLMAYDGQTLGEGREN
jgi:hypothetical protein